MPRGQPSPLLEVQVFLEAHLSYGCHPNTPIPSISCHPHPFPPTSLSHTPPTTTLLMDPPLLLLPATLKHPLLLALGVVNRCIPDRAVPRRHLPNIVCVRGKIKNEEIFPKGGKSVTWITDGSSSSSEKENIDPTTSVHKNSHCLPIQSHSHRSSGVDFTPQTFFASAPLLSAQEPSPVLSRTSPAKNSGLLVTPCCNGGHMSYIVSPIHVPGPEDK